MQRLVRAMALLAFGATDSLRAEESPYRGMEARGIKALSSQQIADLLAGRGMGQALPGELNGYPGPKHVLDLAGELALIAEQAAAIRASFDGMQSRAIELGKQVVEAEDNLDRLFADGSVTNDSLNAATARIGKLNGELRAVHLLAHLETRALLTPEQRSRYQSLRGYSDGHGSAAGHRAHHDGR
ncbi:MAG: periplasmic heavy metal sensor [Rhodanobacteraceae bacterium]|nr:periplasmic heavy metal sensor [Rhodanobacteraceae bacterium]HPF74157.1 hypothetical protein [Xanthomonadaceae bacterium]HRY00529.1 hypothetical protein [Xanthomonadaceae bacterium]